MRWFTMTCPERTRTPTQVGHFFPCFSCLHLPQRCSLSNSPKLWFRYSSKYGISFQRTFCSPAPQFVSAQTPTRWSTMTSSWARRAAATARWTTAGAPASSRATTRPATGRGARRTACPTPSWEESPLRGKPMCVQQVARTRIHGTASPSGGQCTPRIVLSAQYSCISALG